jgi:hypothetical protein
LTSTTGVRLFGWFARRDCGRRFVRLAVALVGVGHPATAPATATATPAASGRIVVGVVGVGVGRAGLVLPLGRVIRRRRGVVGRCAGVDLDGLRFY